MYSTCMCGGNCGGGGGGSNSRGGWAVRMEGKSEDEEDKGGAKGRGLHQKIVSEQRGTTTQQDWQEIRKQKSQGT